MPNTTGSKANRWVTFLSAAFTWLVLVTVFAFSSVAVAQSNSPNADQWAQSGGQIVASGSYDFENTWLAAHRYGDGGGKYWKNDEPRDKPASHSAEEVLEDVLVRVGEVTVRGPGFLATFLRTKYGNAGAVLKFPRSGKDFHTQSLGKMALLKGSDGEWRWHPDNIQEINPIATHGGQIPDSKTITLEVWVYNDWSDFGIWGRGYGAPKGIEYEFWYFPSAGGSVVATDDPCKDLPPDQLAKVTALRKQLAEYAHVKNMTLNSLASLAKQLAALDKRDPLSTGYFNEYQNNTLGNTPVWTKKNLDILKNGAGGGTASYLFDKEKWKAQIGKSVTLQKQNLEVVNNLIAEIKTKIANYGCK